MEDFSGNVGTNPSLPNSDDWLRKKMALVQGALPSHLQNRMPSWIEKIDNLLDRLADVRAHHNDGGKDMDADKVALSAELHSLATENNFLLDKLQALQSELVNRRQFARNIQDQADRAKSNYLQCLSEKNEIESEISFMRDETDAVNVTLMRARANYDKNMASLSKIVEKIRFANGEVELWAEKMVELEAEVPEQSRELAYLNGQIDSANISLIDLSDKLRAIERNFKTAYYKDQGRSL